MTWAFRNGPENAELQTEIIYFWMGKVFHFTPEQVDKIPMEQVMNMLHLDNEWRKKEAEHTEKGMRR